MYARKKKYPSDGKELMIMMIRLPCWIASLAGTVGAGGRRFRFGLG